jgi:hypothetical protein
MEADVLTRRVDRMCLILLCLALGLLSPVAAQDTANTPPRVDYETYRAELLRFLDMFEEVAVHFRDGYRREQLALARRMLERVKPEDFAQAFPEGGPEISPLLQATEDLRSALSAARQPTAPEVPGPSLPTLPDRPPILGACNGIAHDSTTSFALLIVQQAAEVLLSASGRVCDQVAVVAGFGANTSAVCLPLEIALTAAKIPFELASFCGGEEDSSFLEGTFDRVQHLHGDLQTEAASIRSNDDTNTNTVVNNDNANRDTIVNNDNSNTSTVMSNDNSNRVQIINNDNANTGTVINNDNSNRNLIVNNDNSNRDVILANIHGAKGEILAELRAVACDIVRLLNTPEGRRSSEILSCQGQPGFPYNFPER